MSTCELSIQVWWWRPNDNHNIVLTVTYKLAIQVLL